MAPYAPTPVAPIDFGMSKKKLISSLSSAPKNDIASTPKKKTVLDKPTDDLRQTLNPIGNIGQNQNMSVSPMINSTPTPQKTIGEYMNSAQKPQEKSMWEVSQANAGEGILSQYMSDPSISDENKKYSKNLLDGGKISKENLEKAIVDKYYSNGTKQEPSMWDEFAGKAKKSMEETVSEYEKQQAELDKTDRSGVLPSVGKFIQGAGAGANVIGDLAGAGLSTYVTPYIKAAYESTSLPIAANVAGEGLKTIGSAISENTPEIVKEGLQYTGRKIGDAYNIAKENLPQTVATIGGGLDILSAIPGAGLGVKGGLKTAELGVDAVKELADYNLKKSIKGAIKEAGEGLTSAGEKIIIPERTMKENIVNKLIGPDAEKAMTVLSNEGKTKVQDLANRAVMPGAYGKSAKAITQTATKDTEKGMRTLWELQRTRKVEGTLDDMPGTVQTMINGLDKYGAIIGKNIENVKGLNIDTTDLAESLKASMDSAPNFIKSSEGFTKLAPLLSDLESGQISIGNAFKIKKDGGKVLAKMYKEGLAGTDSYDALKQSIEGISTKIDDMIEKNGGDIPELLEARRIYSDLKKIELPFAKSMQVHLRRSGMSLAEQMAIMQNLDPVDWISNPIGSLKNTLVREGAKIIKDKNSREGNMKDLFQIYDDDAQNRLIKQRLEEAKK